MDFDKEDDGTIIIDGKHMIEFDTNPSTGEVEWENQGTTTAPKPKIVSIEIIDKTDTTIKVKVTTKRNVGGTLIYSIQEENGVYQEIERVKQTATGELAQEEYTFTLDPNKIYDSIKVEAITENGEKASKEIGVTTIPTLREEHVRFRYSVNGKTIGENEYTKESVIVEVTVTNSDMKEYQLQYTTGDPEVASNWSNYKTGVKFTINGAIYLRLAQEEEVGKYLRKNIKNIDTKAPNTFTPTVENSNITTNSITVKGKTTDATETEETAGSGIAKYYFGIEEGNNKTDGWEPTWQPVDGQVIKDEASYKFEGLKHNTTYSIRMKAIDGVGYETKSEIITVITATVPNGIAISYSNSNWTNGNVTVTLINNSGSAYKVQYSRNDGNSWNDYISGIEYSANGTIQARLTDNLNPAETGNVGAVVTGNVLKIDTTGPSISTTTPLTATSTTVNSITLKIRTTDTKSGLGKIKWYYKKSTDDQYASVEEIYQTMNGATAGATTEQEKTKTLTGLTVGTQYSIYAEVYDVAGNKTTSGIINPITKRQYTVTYNANGGTGAPESQIKTEGTALSLSGTVPTRSDYAFKGWATSADATTATYQPNSSYTIDSNLNLFAVWEETTIIFSNGPRVSSVSGGVKSTDFTATQSVLVYLKISGSASSWSGTFMAYGSNGSSFSRGSSSGASEATITVNSGNKFQMIFTGSYCSGGGYTLEVKKITNLAGSIEYNFR